MISFASGNHESNFHDIFYGRLDMQYLLFWLQLHNSYILGAVVEDLSDDVGFDSTNKNTDDDENNNSFGSVSTTALAAQKKRRSPANVLKKHVKEKDLRSNVDDLLKVYKQYMCRRL
jgi:hypothetical protein